MTKKTTPKPTAAISPVFSTSLPIETKLTRSELIDILMQDVISDLEEKVKEAEAAPSPLKDLALSDVQPYLPATTDVRIYSERRWNQYGEREAHTTLRICLDANVEMPPKIKKLFDQNMAREKAIEEAKRALGRAVNQRSALKTEILKKFLKTTQEGTALLNQLDSFRADLKKRLNESK